MADARVVIYDNVIRSWSLPAGMTWKWARQRAQRIRGVAFRSAPKRTGYMASRISVGYETAPSNHVEMTVGVDVDYALPVHEGAKPHRITANQGRFLVIPASRWSSGMIAAEARRQTRAAARGRSAPARSVALFRYVNHPGNRGNPFLADALRSVMDDL